MRNKKQIAFEKNVHPNYGLFPQPLLRFH